MEHRNAPGPRDRWLLTVAGVLLMIGGPLHPRPDLSLSFELSTAAMLGDPRWIPAHAAMLAAFAVACAGFVRIARSESGAARASARLAAVGLGAAALESVPHLFAFVDREALGNGGPIPVVKLHLTMATLSYPLSGFSIAAFAWMDGRGRGRSARILAVVAAIGACAHGLAAPVVVATRDQHFSRLFMGATLVSLWLIVAGLTPRRLHAPEA